MAVENFTGLFLPDELIKQLTTLTKFFQAIGGLIVAYIIFGVLNAIWNRKRSQEIIRMRKLLEQINRKLDKKR
jgi:hypothetical protein